MDLWRPAKKTTKKEKSCPKKLCTVDFWKPTKKTTKKEKVAQKMMHCVEAGKENDQKRNKVAHKKKREVEKRWWIGRDEKRKRNEKERCTEVMQSKKKLRMR